MTVVDVSEETLIEIIESVWTTVLELPIVPRGESLCAQSPRALAVSVHIVGEWNGAVLYLPTDAFAARTASIMFAIPPERVSREDIQDAAAELCNIVAGSLKSVLPGPSSLSLPMVAEGADYEMHVRKSHPLMRLSFRCEGESLQFIVLEAEPPRTTA